MIFQEIMEKKIMIGTSDTWQWDDHLIESAYYIEYCRIFKLSNLGPLNYKC